MPKLNFQVSQQDFQRCFCIREIVINFGFCPAQHINAFRVCNIRRAGKNPKLSQEQQSNPTMTRLCTISTKLHQAIPTLIQILVIFKATTGLLQTICTMYIHDVYSVQKVPLSRNYDTGCLRDFFSFFMTLE
jgi:hypothetical protein